MTRKRRFFIFFSSAAFMCFFIFFSLKVRQDDPLGRWLQWLPENKVKGMILDRHTADGEVYPRKITYEDSVKLAMEQHNVSALEVRHHLREADIEFSHDLSKPRQSPKQYYLLSEINKKEYYLVIQVLAQHSNVIAFGLAPEED